MTDSEFDRSIKAAAEAAPNVDEDFTTRLDYARMMASASLAQRDRREARGCLNLFLLILMLMVASFMLGFWLG